MMLDALRLLHTLCRLTPRTIAGVWLPILLVKVGVHAGNVGYLVLDEADKMLSLGLQPQLDAIRAHVLPDAPPAPPPKKQKGKGVQPVAPAPQVTPAHVA